jgi:N-acetylmuramic acid 6-phosphate (MurNAc-6-P) etherase
MFDLDNGEEEVLRVVSLLNVAMGDIKKTKTVEELQAVINNLTRVINEIKKSLASQGRLIT